jgi:hypothetical protein
MDVIDITRARADIERIAGEDPDRTASCHYLKENDNEDLVPHCIVGVYLSELGFSCDEIDTLGTTRIDMLSMLNGDVRDLIRKRFTAAALIYLGRVQEIQDEGVSWGEAVKSTISLYYDE